ncbi:unnamed protein product [Discula destructiva]
MAPLKHASMGRTSQPTAARKEYNDLLRGFSSLGLAEKEKTEDNEEEKKESPMITTKQSAAAKLPTTAATAARRVLEKKKLPCLKKEKKAELAQIATVRRMKVNKKKQSVMEYALAKWKTSTGNAEVLSITPLEKTAAYEITTVLQDARRHARSQKRKAWLTGIDERVSDEGCSADRIEAMLHDAGADYSEHTQRDAFQRSVERMDMEKATRILLKLRNGELFDLKEELTWVECQAPFSQRYVLGIYSRADMRRLQMINVQCLRIMCILRKLLESIILAHIPSSANNLGGTTEEE